MSEESLPYTITKLRGELAIAWREQREDGTWHRPRYSLGTSDRVEAGLLAERFWQRRSNKSFSTIGEIVPAWLNTHQHLAAHQRNMDAWKAAKDFWSGVRPEHVTRELCADYVKLRDRAARTMRYEMEIIVRALYWLKEEKHIKDVPKFYLPGIPDRVVRHLTKEQFRIFMDATIMPHVRLFCMVAIATGGRKKAILELQWDQVDLDRRIITLNRPGRVQTNKKRATVPINDQLHEALVEAKKSRISEFVIEYAGDDIDDIKTGLKLTGERAGIKATAHMFRHSAAVWMAEAGERMEVIAQYLGHEDVKTTIKIYARFSPNFLQGAAQALVW